MIEQRRSVALMITWLVLLAVTCFLILMGVGSIRYGGLNGFYQRIWQEIRTQMSAVRPHSAFVPTPFPAPTVDASTFANQLAETTPTTAIDASTSANQAVETAPTATPLPPLEIANTVNQAPLPTAAFQPQLPGVQLTGFTHMWQTWNNCGPATLATNLSFFDQRLGQADVASVLKPNPDDKNVNPEEMVAFAQAQGLQARAFINGSEDRLKLLLSNNIPVLIETWLEPKPGDGLGHYRLMIGFDDAARQWIASDSYISTGVKPNEPYSGIRVSYDVMDDEWRVFNRLYVVIYPDHLAAVVQDIIGEDMSQSIMWRNSLTRYQREIQERPNDPFAWFNLGTTLVRMGQFEQAATAYDQARTIGLPWRMLWYQFGPFQAYYEVGRYDELISLADATINSGGEIEEIYYWKGRALVAKNDVAGAKVAWQGALELKPTYQEAATALASLP